MKMTIFPKSRRGKRSGVFLLMAVAALFPAGIKALTGLPFPEASMLLPVMIAGPLVLFGVSLVDAIRAVKRKEERSLLVFGIILIDIAFIAIVSLILLGVLVSP